MPGGCRWEGSACHDGEMPELPATPDPLAYQLRIVLRGVSPLIWRRLLVEPVEPCASDLCALLWLQPRLLLDGPRSVSGDSQGGRRMPSAPFRRCRSDQVPGGWANRRAESCRVGLPARLAARRRQHLEGSNAASSSRPRRAVVGRLLRCTASCSNGFSPVSMTRQWL
jgi:hypothetical protein